MKQLPSLLNRVVYYTIKDPKAASRLANQLVTTPNDLIILPFVDHPGPISAELLSRQFSLLTFSERDGGIRERFRHHVKQNFGHKNIRIHSEDLFDLSYSNHNDDAQRKCSEIVKECLKQDYQSENVSEADNNQRTCDRRVKFLVPLLQSKYEAGFLRNVYYQMSLKIGLCSNTLVNYYFLMSDRQYGYLSAQPSGNFNLYRSTTILYNTIFNIHKLDSLDLESSFGISLKILQNTSKKTDSSYRQVHLVWLEPKLNVLTSLDTKSLLEYRFFINQIMAKRKGLVSTFIERWFGDCSEDIIKFGITASTRVGDLYHDQYYKLFIYLKNRPQYNNSTFLQAAQRSEEHLHGT